ncbi:ABC1 kinase family protein [Aquabacterium parvum]|uniref:ABC1 kinase family protein n=1 Tax=Aquabacterium parvum TaxID=70584 RepID=UPI000718DD18|nr:AarF/UbiB family protein [Aquabacterium parvum]MBU0916766.1 ubiquinone biosynthesis protein UbiB [Gammaproteobacteria bacterium]
MLLEALTSVRDLGRLQEIASVLIRYGFGDVVRRLGLANLLEKAGHALHWEDAEAYAHMPPPQRVRRALEELGTTFIKLGQILSTRVDQFEPDWIAEFGQLQDNTPASPWPEVLAQLTEDLGAPPDTLFAHFDPAPLAAGSIAQVHAARLEDGTEVIVKVRRPGIKPKVEADLRWLARLAATLEADHPELRAYQPREMVRQFARSLHRELDLANEGRQSDRIAANFRDWHDGDSAGAATIVIPRIHWLWTRERVCVQDRVQGIPGRRLDLVDAAGLDRKLLARRGARAVLKMIVQDGLFHADPHAGNVFYLPDNRIAFIDFGMVGRLSTARRDELIRLLVGLVQRDPQAVADVMLDWAGEHATDEEGLVMDLQAFVDTYHGLTLQQINLATMLSEVTALLRQHHLALPADLALLFKSFITLEGMGRSLDGDFNMAEEALPLLKASVRARYRPKALMQRGWRALDETLSLIGGLPSDLARLLRAARRGRLEVHIDIANLNRVGNQVESALNRLVVGLVVAALIVGSSIVMTVPGGPTLLGLPFFGLLGFVGATLGSLWLIGSISRSAKAKRLSERSEDLH